uniref:Acetylglutamate kinase n=1 Tax=Dermonema virens TaxID=1077399 RepID=A0A1G4NRX9_9FLOR|nr:Acetylglutamate kinase [Dermonema virens]SCW21420.1 Acetylglutamate kinase [Dermonema virens]
MNDSDKIVLDDQILSVVSTLYKGKVIVIKYGGAAMKDSNLTNKVVQNISALHNLGIKCVVVHGGGPFINNWLKRLNIKPVFKDGIRVTDSQTMNVVQMVLAGQINKNIVSMLNTEGLKSVGLSGQDNRLILVSPSKELQDNRVADVSNINIDIIDLLLDNNYIPVIAPIGVSILGKSYNINADLVAAAISERMLAESLIMLTDTPGILRDRNNPLSTIKKLKIDDAKKLVSDKVIFGGMLPKVEACMRVVSRGVKKATILDGRIPDSLLLSFLSDSSVSTTIEA